MNVAIAVYFFAIACLFGLMAKAGKADKKEKRRCTILMIAAIIVAVACLFFNK